MHSTSRSFLHFTTRQTWKSCRETFTGRFLGTNAPCFMTATTRWRSIRDRARARPDDFDESALGGVVRVGPAARTVRYCNNRLDVHGARRPRPRAR